VLLGYSVGYSTGSKPAESQRVAEKVQVTRVGRVGLEPTTDGL
jgi:hypothetical protein